MYSGKLHHTKQQPPIADDMKKKETYKKEKGRSNRKLKI